MVKVNLNASVIAELQLPSRGQTIVWDTKLKGFGVRLTKSAKSFICESRVAGRTRRVTIGSTSLFRVAEARKEAKRLLGQMASDLDPNAEKAERRARTMTLQEALDAYIAGRDLKPNTIQMNRNLIKSNYGSWLNKELRFISPAMVVQRFERITERGSPSVANSATRTLRAIWNYVRVLTASDTGEYTLPENPCNRVSDLKRWHKPKRRQKHLTNDQYPMFFTSLNIVARETSSNRHKNAGTAFSDFAELILRTGLRKTEAATLTWSRINFQNRTFSISEEMAKNGHELVLPMSWQIEEIFDRRSDLRDTERYVFPGEGKSGAIGSPQKTLKRLRNAMNDPNLGFHDLRRSFAVLCERLDISHSKLKRLLNHSDGNDVTMGYLVSTDPERLRDAVQAVSDEIDRLSHLGGR